MLLYSLLFKWLHKFLVTVQYVCYFPIAIYLLALYCFIEYKLIESRAQNFYLALGSVW